MITAHAGKAYDIGCVTVRRFESPSEMPVLWSAYQDVMPVFCLSASTSHLLTLEWLGTFDMVHVGSASLYTRRGDSLVERRDLSESRAVETRRSAAGLMKNLELQKNMRFSTSGIFK